MSEKLYSDGYGFVYVTELVEACDKQKESDSEHIHFPVGLLRMLQSEIGRLKADNQRLRGSTDHPEHYCHRCSGRNALSWYADSDVWNAVVREGDKDIPEILCPICFVELAKEKGVNPTAWRLSKEGDDPESVSWEASMRSLVKRAEMWEAEYQRLREAAKPFVVDIERLPDDYPVEFMTGVFKDWELGAVTMKDFRALAAAVTDKPTT